MVSELRRSYAAVVTTESQNGEGTSTGQQAGAASNQNPMNQSAMQRSDEVDEPMYLHFSENPNLALVSPPLTEINYASWSRAMKIALEVKNKFGFVDGTIVKPGVDDPRYPVWKRCNNIVCSWIFKSLSSTIAERVLYFEIAADIWNVLQKRYSQVDPHRIAEIQNEIYKCTQGNLSINEYFTKSNALWVQLKAMRPVPACECVPRCSCTLMSKIQKEKEEDQIIRFLEGLNEEYENIKAGILVMDPMPIMEKVLNMALKMERKLKSSINLKSIDLTQANAIQNVVIPSTDEHSVVAAGISNNKKKFNGNSGKNIPNCTFCGRTGHTVDKCYKKHGFPPGWVAGYKTKNKQTQDAQQFNPSVSQVSDTGLSAEQFQKLLTLLQG
ncbi:PREDICTED: uncharacterized protein LOC109157774 [Ipomoea nil]|uniref:uncharacterized protein LOC109157774 n=1 Tax=Ipomoea nil TaxID=35883 RepID=UPI0009015749|nr:PREDICTED: uncharacterized protein LOC109157774 [Ipomoea nil]